MISNRVRNLFPFKNPFIQTIPNSLHFASLASLLALLMVSGVTFYSIQQIHLLKKSTDSLLLITIPMKQLTYRLENSLKQTRFLLHKYIALKDPVYFSATLEKIGGQKKILNRLMPMLNIFPKTQSVLKLLQTDINYYWEKILELDNHPTDAIPHAIENIVEVDIKDFNHQINLLAKERAAHTIGAAGHLINILVILITSTIIFSAGIIFLYSSDRYSPYAKNSSRTKAYR